MPAQLSNTCRTCHREAGPRISTAAIHLDLATGGHGIEFFIACIFIALIVFTFGPSLLMTALKMFHNVIGRRDPEVHAPRAAAGNTHGPAPSRPQAATFHLPPAAATLVPGDLFRGPGPDRFPHQVCRPRLGRRRGPRNGRAARHPAHPSLVRRPAYRRLCLSPDLRDAHRWPPAPKIRHHPRRDRLAHDGQLRTTSSR